ncbi:hypothetical protein INQ07_25280, partial [Escherichia coli]|nr:hypothetical protein [Escherichia coli]
PGRAARLIVWASLIVLLLSIRLLGSKATAWAGDHATAMGMWAEMRVCILLIAASLVAFLAVACQAAFLRIWNQP